jgi:hypothetical protein
VGLLPLWLVLGGGHQGSTHRGHLAAGKVWQQGWRRSLEGEEGHVGNRPYRRCLLSWAAAAQRRVRVGRRARQHRGQARKRLHFLQMGSPLVRRQRLQGCGRAEGNQHGSALARHRLHPRS